MLPKLSGLDICREVRKDDSLNRLPILMLTARGDEADRVVGLEMGADDYVTKPFSPRELLARVKALLRRAEPPADSPRTIEVGKAGDRSGVLPGQPFRQTGSAEHARVPAALLSCLATEPRVHARSASGCRVGHGSLRDAAQRRCLRAALARENRKRSGKSHPSEDRSRRGLLVRNSCGVISSAKLALTFLALLVRRRCLPWIFSPSARCAGITNGRVWRN